MNKGILTFNIIGKNVKIIRRRNAVAITALLLYPLVVLIFNPKPESFLNIFAVSAFILLLIFYAIYRKRTNPYLKAGMLTFSNEVITAFDKSFSVVNIADVIITYGGYLGQESDLAPLGIDTIGNKKGGENYLTVITDDREKFEYQFLSTKDSDFKNLTTIIAEYQNKGIKARLVKKNE